MIRPTFMNLKSHFQPSGTHTCKMLVQNTSAIRLSEALSKTDRTWLSDFKTSGYKICPHGYIPDVEDLAWVIQSRWGDPDQIFQDPEGEPEELEDGIVFYIDIPGVPGPGYVDLWYFGGGIGEEFWDAGTVWYWQLP